MYFYQSAWCIETGGVCPTGGLSSPFTCMEYFIASYRNDALSAGTPLYNWRPKAKQFRGPTLLYCQCKLAHDDFIQTRSQPGESGGSEKVNLFCSYTPQLLFNYEIEILHFSDFFFFFLLD